MLPPTDRGYVLVVKNPDGSTNVSICSEVYGGIPVNCYAQHFNSTDLRVDPSIALKDRGSGQVIEQVVEVVRDGGSVVIRQVVGQ